jgi:hypothetical protein
MKKLISFALTLCVMLAFSVGIYTGGSPNIEKPVHLAKVEKVTKSDVTAPSAVEVSASHSWPSPVMSPGSLSGYIETLFKSSDQATNTKSSPPKNLLNCSSRYEFKLRLSCIKGPNYYVRKNYFIYNSPRLNIDPCTGSVALT